MFQAGALRRSAEYARGRHRGHFHARDAPNLPGAVLHRQAWTSLDVGRKFGWPEGNALHSDLTVDHILFMRSVPECSRYHTRGRGLPLRGSGTHPGGGIAGGAGANAMRAILRDAR